MDLDRHWDRLSRSVVEDFTSVRKRDTLALPHAAVGMGTLKVLDRALNVSIMVRDLVVIDLITTRSLETISWHARGRAADVAMGGHGSNEASKGSDDGVGLHV